jgi:hypothetical protein
MAMIGKYGAVVEKLLAGEREELVKTLLKSSPVTTRLIIIFLGLNPRLRHQKPMLNISD